jgi:starch phosphorylase
MWRMYAGREDLDRAANALGSRLPWPLAPLARVAYNYRWAWLPDGPDLFRELDPRRWRLCHDNPVRMLEEVAPEALIRAAADSAYVARAESVEQAIRDDLARPVADVTATEDRPIAFFCAEYGVHQSMPIYSGGLGALAGDILKEASDQALPFVAVGLMYRRGYFRQRIDVSGWQQEYWVQTDPERLPAALVSGPDGQALHVTVPIGEHDVTAQIWRVDVGRVPLYLLDTEIPENDRISRWITSRLYDGDPDTRLAQYVLLGAGGMAALKALGIDPGVVHMNEGHAAFTALALAEDSVCNGDSLEDALASARGRTVFTTHTPVPAGNDTYPADQVRHFIRRIAERCNTDPEPFIRLGRTNPDDAHEPFGVTQFSLRGSRAANGVSRRHGGVSRDMWQGLWPDRSAEDVPIGHVTNGVHVPTWIGAPMRRLLDRHLGELWPLRAGDPELWEKLDDVADADLWAARCEQRRNLVEFVRDQSVLDRIARGEQRHHVDIAARTFDPDALTIGFARRLATYKRLNLILHDAARALAVLGGNRPVQLVLAGKAHPRDDGGKSLVQGLFSFRDAPQVSARVVFLEDYDLGMAARLVRGCDVWVNLPRPPMEASGTSGMKSVVNGGLQLSVLDGWWDEGYDGTNGWALPGDVYHDQGAQDHRDAGELYRIVEQEVVPEFYERDANGVPLAWMRRVRASMKTLIAEFSASRMVREYAERIYPETAQVSSK